MRSLRLEQILLLLLFVVVPLLNLLVRWLQRRAREQQRPAPVEPRAAEPGREGWPPAPLPPRARMIEPALPREGRRETRPAPRPQPVVRRARPLGGRAAVRRAIVAMTILGPCRGLEEPAPVRPPSQPAASPPVSR